ncbi:MAG: ROK family protein [Bdellovibrionia bacterium]
MTQKVLSYDLGGTKLAVGIVNRRGEVLESIQVPVLMEQGKQAVIQQLTHWGKELIKKHPTVQRAGIASAGPLDPVKGLLLDPTNFAGPQGTWGKVPLTQILSKQLKIPVFLENDAAAAILAEHWVGSARNHQDAMILTLGTGLGTGILCNGELARAGKHRHTEAGHIILHFQDLSAPCGCGNLGCAEAYLSGRNFGRRAQQRLGRSDLTAKDIVDLAKRHDPRALAAFEEYSEVLAVALYSYTKIYCPEIFIFAGSFAQAAPLFLPHAKAHLKRLMERELKTNPMPKLVVSKLKNHSGLIGGAYVAFHRSEEGVKKARQGTAKKKNQK